MRPDITPRSDGYWMLAPTWTYGARAFGPWAWRWVPGTVATFSGNMRRA